MGEKLRLQTKQITARRAKDRGQGIAQQTSQYEHQRRRDNLCEVQLQV